MQSTHNLLVFNVVCMFTAVCHSNTIFNSYMLKKVIITIEFTNHIEIYMDKILLAFMMIVHYRCANKIFAL